MKLTFVDFSLKNSDILLENAIIESNNKARMIWIETPTNPSLKMVDILKLSNIGHKYGLIVVVDNTFATPYNQNPILFGADIIVHSITKYLNGHSDIIMGITITNNEILYNKMKFVQNTLGAIPSPFDCYLVMRGMKTFHLRCKQHSQNAIKLAKFLEKHPKVMYFSNYPSYLLD